MHFWYLQMLQFVDKVCKEPSLAPVLRQGLRSPEEQALKTHPRPLAVRVHSVLMRPYLLLPASPQASAK